MQNNEYEIALSIIKEYGLDQCSIWGNQFALVYTDEAWAMPADLSSRFGIPFYSAAYGSYNGTEYFTTYFDMGRYRLPIQVRAYSQAMGIQAEDMERFIDSTVETYVEENRSDEFERHILCFKILAEIYGYDPSDYIPFTVETLKEGA
ncbi:hypothetical protein G6M86_20905 [Agrobacterium tumefaciens]|uniref:Uncharacterized protein n=1 Tax=Agrobacterium tumefaciens TaxID=358 RepID=A0AAJ4TC66_AGRTU|nr:hypothetical protein G6M86_20905 [Agrobacterium tumefaciens]